MSEIPTVDLEAGEDAVVEQLRAVCSGHGFFYLKGHGVPADQMELVLAAARSFFKLPDDVKLRVGPGSAGPKFRGYSPWRAIALDPKRQQGGDTREQFSIGVEASSDSEEARQWPTVLGPNKWPDSVPDSFDGGAFRKTMWDYYTAIEGLGMRMLPLLSRSLHGAPDSLSPLFVPPLVTMNLNHYAATPSDPAAGLFGCGAHTDYGVLTFLLTDDNPGLQICRGRDKGAADALEFQLDDPEKLSWIPVPPPPRGVLVVNTGDMLERLSNGLYRSNLHRVITAPAGRERISIPVFFEPALPALIQPLPCCLAADADASGTPAAPKYSPVVSGQFLLNKYAATGEGEPAGT